MKEKIAYIIKLAISFLLFFFIRSILKFSLSLFNIDFSKLSNKELVIYQLLASFIIFIILFILYYKDYKKDLYKFKKDVKNNVIYIIKMFIIFIILKFILSFISMLILVLLGYDISVLTSVNQELIVSYVKAAPILMLISSSILAPLYEEGLFRLGIGKVIKNKIVFVLISGALFGFLHIFPLDSSISLVIGLIQSITYVSMGIFLSYIYAKKDNIFISTGVHFLNNIISILAIIRMI